MGKHSKPGCALTLVVAGVVLALLGALACGGGGRSEPKPRLGGQCRLEGEQVSVYHSSTRSHRKMICHDGRWERA